MGNTKSNQSPSKFSQTPLKFHNKHGDNCEIVQDGFKAIRKDSFCKGILFSDRPVECYERVCIRSTEFSNRWSGTLRIGFTSHNPETITNLPKYACPDLVEKGGYWAQAVPEKDVKSNTLVHYYFTPNGEVHFGVNGVDKKDFYKRVDTRKPLWCLIDLYGNCTAIEFVNKRQSILSISSNQSPAHIQDEEIHAANSLSSNNSLGSNDSLSSNDSNITIRSLTFHSSIGQNVILNNSSTKAWRSDDEYSNGYVFTSEPVRRGERLIIQVLATENMYIGSLAFGLTSCDPATIDTENMPEDSDLLLDRPEYWVISKDVANTPAVGDELSFVINDDGAVQFSKNGSIPSTFMHVDNSSNLWAFWDIYGNTEKIRLVGATTDPVTREDQNNQNNTASYENYINNTTIPDVVVELTKELGEKLSFEGALELAAKFSDICGEVVDFQFNSREILNLINEAINSGDIPITKTYHETVCLMVLNLLFPSLRKEIQKCTAMPLVGFRSVEDIKAYIKDAIKYGLSAEFNRGAIYVLGNTHVGKTSLVRTLKKFVENPDQNPSFQTKDEDCLLETEVVEVYSDIQDKCVPSSIPEVKLSQGNAINFTDKEVKEERDPGEKFIASVYDFGGHSEYFAASQLLIGTSGTFFICFDSTGNLCCDGKGNVRKKEDVKKEYYSSVGTYIDLIVQKAMKTKMEPKIALVATKCDEPPDKLKEVFSLVLDLATEQVTLMDSEASRVFFVNEVLETTTCERLAQNTMIQLHAKISAILNSPKLQTHLNMDIPLSWFKFLDNIRKYDLPQITIKKAAKEFEKISNEGEVFSKLSDEDALVLKNINNDIVDRIVSREEYAWETSQQHHNEDTESNAQSTNGDFTNAQQNDPIKVLQNITSESAKKCDNLTIPDFVKHIKPVLNVFSSLGEIIYFQDVESLKDIVIPKPMDLVISLRSILNHKLRKKLEKTSIENRDFIQDLIEKGILSHSNFVKMYAAQEKSSFTSTEILDFLINLDLACSLGNNVNDKMILIPCLMQDKNEKRFNAKEDRMIKKENSVCIQYLFDNITNNLGIYNKVLQLIAQNFVFDITMSFCQKIEEKQLGNVGGIYGILEYREAKYDFILTEIETDMSLEYETDSSEVCSIARHRGFRFHLNPRNDSNMSHTEATQIFNQIDKIVQTVADGSPFSRSILCKNCLQIEKLHPGSFRLPVQLKLKFESDCLQCTEPYKDPFKNTNVRLETALRSPAHQNIFNLSVGNLNIQNMTVQNLTTQLGIKEVEDASMLLKLISPCNDEKIQEQKLTRLTENQVDFSLLKISTLARSTCLLRYTPPKGLRWHGTGFFLAVENFDGLIFVSAGNIFLIFYNHAFPLFVGHNMEHNGILLQDYENFHFYFNNIDGHQKIPSLGGASRFWKSKSASSATGYEDIIPLNLKTIMDEHDCTLATTVYGMQLIKRKNSPPSYVKTLSGDDKKLDYFAIIFNDPNIRANMQKKGLRFLQCGSAPDLAPKLDEPLLIFGHPGVDKCNCPARKCSCTHPLRLTYGQETGSSPNRIEYDMDTLSGNSGSAVTGKSCMVKGIHSSGSSTKNCNLAQPMESVLENLRRHKLLPSNFP